MAALLLGATLTIGAHAAVGTLFSAQSGDSYQLSSGGRFNVSNGPVVITADTIQVESGNPALNDSAIRLNNVTFVGGPSSVTVTNYTGEFTSISSMNLQDSTLSIVPDDKQRVDVTGGMRILNIKSMDGSDGADGQLDFSYDSPNEASLITIHGLRPGQTIEAYELEGQVSRLDSNTTTDDGTVTLSLVPGSYDVDIRAEPRTLYIREETDPDDPINHTTVDLTFYVPGSDQVYTRSTNSGELDISFLPENKRIVVEATASGYEDRQIYLEDISRQQVIYLANSTNTTTVPITFVIDDRSGNFPASSTTIEIQQVINDTFAQGVAQWQTVAGGPLSASAEFGPTPLRQGVRHRVIVANAEGDRRVLGTYTPTQQETKTLVISQISWQAPESGTVYTDATLNTTQGITVTAFYNDTETTTDQLDIYVYTPGNFSSPIYHVTEYDVDAHTEVFTVPSQYGTDLYVRFVGQRSGDNINRTVPLGDIKSQSIDIDPYWLSLLAQVALAAILGLVAGSMHYTGGIVLVSVGFAMDWLGFVTFHPASLGIAGAVAILSALYGPGGGV